MTPFHFRQGCPGRCGPPGVHRWVTCRKGFTLIELLVVMAIVAVLAGLLLPALSGARSRALQVQCLSNYRQLNLCWLLYLDDFRGELPPNETVLTGGREGANATARTWVTGNAYTDTTPTNLIRGMLFGYHRSVAIYRCPADRSTVRDAGKIRRFRSVSMNSYMNDVPDPTDRGCWHRASEIVTPSPARAFVLVDEHENSIENARFFASPPGVWRWVDFPSVRHAGATTLSFADGHSESWKLTSPDSRRIGKLPAWLQGQATAVNDPDLRRFHEAVPRTPL